MSILTKIIVLFLVSLSLMFVLGIQIDRINTERTEALVTQHYLQDARKIFPWLATADPQTLEKKLEGLNLVHYGLAVGPDTKILLEQAHSFGELKILRTTDGEYLLAISYMDENLVLSDTALRQSFREEWLLNTLVALVIVVLLFILLIILKMLSPLKAIATKMQHFSEGEFQSRADVAGNDEIADVARTYNAMARNIESLITSRQELLRDIGHELRTPISKGLFAIEKLEPSTYKNIIHKSFTELERLTQELLEIEQLHTAETLAADKFKAETLILEALSRLMLEDESKIALDIRSNFKIQGDLSYLALALKNLIDNALKYAQEYPVNIIADNSRVSVINRGEKLSEEIGHYLQPFTQEESSRQSSGFGLGLNIVKKVLDKHDLPLEYEYTAGCHVFSIRFNEIV